MPESRNAVALALLTLLIASTASAALSPQYDEWRNGPVQWIFTGPEKNAWKKVTSDQAAIDFIDLFWARRDPTPGTAPNEARDEHDSRVKFADERFAERGKRGSLTDRGRVWIVLGPPPGYSEVLARVRSTSDAAPAASSASSGGGRGQSEPTSSPNITGGREQGARDHWVWEHAEASARFGLPRVEVVFVTDPLTHRTIRDVFRRDFGAAEAAVLKKQIKGDYKELPEWAAFGGLVPRMRVVTVSVAAPAPTPAAPSVAVAPAAVVPVVPRGATRLTLTRDVFTINPEVSDPFAKIVAANRFRAAEDLGWIAQYCGQSDQQLSIPFMVRITGNAVDLATELEEVVPDRILASPGCYFLRGAIPLEDMAAGKYTLHLMLDDPIVKSESYDLTQDFVIE